MADSQQQERQWASQLESDRLRTQHMQAMQSQREFTNAARQAQKKKEALSARQRVEAAKSNLRQSSNAIAKTKNLLGLKGIMHSRKRGMWFMIFAMSILGDIFTLFPFVGSFFSLIFSLAIGFIYAVNGYFGVKWGQKALVYVTTFLSELLPVIDMLPFFTVSALVNYVWISSEEYDEDE